MEEQLTSAICYMEREEPVQRLPHLVFAANEAFRRGGSNSRLAKTMLPAALRAKCNTCGFELSGHELLALADITGANEKSAMMKRLRDGKCAREECPSSYYLLFFYDTSQIKWATIFAAARPKEVELASPSPAPLPKKTPKRHVPLELIGRVSAIAVFCLMAWVWHQYHYGGRIPLLREPEHFRVTTVQIENQPTDKRSESMEFR